jgi:hypothetical protein
VTLDSRELRAAGVSYRHKLFMRLREHRNRGISNVGIRYLAMTGEDIEDCIFATVQRFVECVDP